MTFYGVDYDENGNPIDPDAPPPATTGTDPAVPVGRFRRTLLRRSQLRALPPVEPLIAGTLSRRCSAVMVGPTGVGKTFVALSMGCSTATGADWLGRKVERTRGLYVVGEGAYGLDARLNAWEKSWGHQVDDIDLVFSVKPDSLAAPLTWAQMTEEALDLGAGFVVLDTFSSLAPDADETKDAAQITRWLSDLAVRLDGTALLVHHPGWSDSGRVRGGYQLEANVDEVLILAGDAGSNLVTLKRKKVKDGPDGAVMYLKRVERFGSCVIEGALSSESDGPARERVHVLLCAYGAEGGTAAQIVAETGTARSTVTRSLNELVAAGRAEKDEKGKYPRYLAEGYG